MQVKAVAWSHSFSFHPLLSVINIFIHFKIGVRLPWPGLPRNKLPIGLREINNIFQETSLWANQQLVIKQLVTKVLEAKNLIIVVIKCFKKPEFAHVINRVFLSLNCIGTKGSHGNFCPAELGIADTDFTLWMNGWKRHLLSQAIQHCNAVYWFSSVVTMIENQLSRNV